MISVVICTLNRMEQARRAIGAVLAQDFPARGYELLVVDNGSSDGTPSMVLEICRLHSNVRYVPESTVGLSHARNRGWREANGEYVAYLDDDARPVPGWLENADRVISGIRPAVLGGPVLPDYDSPKPPWYKDDYATSIVRTTPGILEREFISGGNSFNRRDILEKLGGFRSDFGMAGNRLWYGEETEMQMRLREEFPHEIMYYHPAVAIRHSVPSGKMRPRWIVHRQYHGGRSFVRARRRETQEPGFLKASLNVLRCVIQILLLVFEVPFRDRIRYPYWQNYVFEKLAPRFGELGAWMEFMVFALQRN